MYSRNENVLVSIGMLSMAGAIGLGRFGPNAADIHFIEGFLIGLSLVVNLSLLIRFRIKRQRQLEEDDQLT
jgi:hypothetical protein